MELDNVEYANIINNKSVVIVCPSKSIEGQALGTYIDSFDIVIRLNNGYFINPSLKTDMGEKTDMVYHYLGLPTEYRQDYDLSVMKKYSIKTLVILPRPEKDNLRIFLQKNQIVSIPYLIIENDLKDELWGKIECLPFCGVWAVYHLLKFDIKSVTVLGMNFFSTGHYIGYDERTEEQQINYALNSQFDQRGRQKQHHIEPQKELLRQLFWSDSRLELDDITKYALGIKTNQYETSKL